MRQTPATGHKITTPGLAKQILEYRTKNLINVSELAHKCRLSHSTILKAEAGEPVSVKTQRKILRVIGGSNGASA